MGVNSTDFGSHCLDTFEGIFIERVSPRAWTGSRTTPEGTLVIGFAKHDVWYGMVTWIPKQGLPVRLGSLAQSSRYCGKRLKRQLRATAKRLEEDRVLDRQVRALSWLFDTRA